MNSKFSKLVACLISPLMLLSAGALLSGCQGKEPDGNGTDLAGTTVRKYIWYNKITDSELAADEYFEEQTGAKLERVMVPWDTIDTKFVLDISANNAVDVVYLQDQKFPMYPIKGIVQPLENLLSDNDPLWKSNAMSNFVFAGKHYGIASGLTPLLLWYNKSMFEENDVKTPLEYYKEGNWNWDAFAEVAKKLTVKGSDGTVQRWGYSTWRLDSIMLTNAGKFVEFMPNGSIDLALNQPNSVKALQFMQDAAFTDKWMDPTGNFTWHQDFRNGKVAMTCEAAFLAWNGDFADLQFEVDFAPLPIGPDNTKSIYPGRVDASGVCAAAKNPKGAVEYIRKIMEYSKLHENESDAKKALTEEQYALNKELGQREMGVAMFMGIGDLQAKQFGLWDSILSRGVPIATAIATETPGWQNEIDICLKDNTLPEVKPFIAPPVIDFEDGLGDYIKADASEALGVVSAEVSGDDGSVIKGKSLVVTANPDSPTGSLLLATDPKKVALPAYHTYKVTVDYKVLEDFAEGGVLAICLRPLNDPFNGANIGWVETDELTAGKQGTLTGEFTPINEIEDLSLICIGQLATKISIDNITITDTNS